MPPDIAANLDGVRERIRAASVRAGRNPNEVRLVAVAKTQPEEAVRRALAAGQADIGENYVQEFLAKADAIPNGVRWHFIGRLQSNKVRQVVGRTVLIHSVDREKLFREIEKRSALRNIRTACLLEVNVGAEDSKGGADPEEAARLVRLSAEWPHVELRGLMSIPPFLDDPEAIRPYHVRLRELRDRLRKDSGFALPELSMGMSTDLEAAVEEGATFVRVGTDIFGPRAAR